MTRTGTRKLSELAKHLHSPVDITSTGWPDVRRTCTEKLGISFDDWQDGAGRLILAKRADGNLASMIDGVGLSLPRQVGKTYLIGAMVFALCVNTPGLLVIWSAHHARTHGETFLSMQSFAERPKVAPHVVKVYTGSGDEEIRFHNGSRILFGARERGFGRGIPGVDVLIFDEAQILSDRALSNMLATMNVSRFGLQLYIGTPPKPEDMSESFTRMRVEALAGTLVDGAWIEFGADADANPEDRKQWAKANPSFPTRTPPQSILRLKRKLTPEDFTREGMGIWDDAAVGTGVINADKWASHKGTPKPHGDVVLALDTTVDRKLSALMAVAGSKTGVPQTWVVDSQAGSAWLTTRVVQVCREHPEVKAIVIDDKKSTEPIAEAVTAALLEAKLPVEIVRTSYPDMAEACAVTYDLIHEGSMIHAGDAALDAAVRGAMKDEREGSFTWSRRKAGAAIVPLVAMSLALWEWRRRVASDYDVMDSFL